MSSARRSIAVNVVAISASWGSKSSYDPVLEAVSKSPAKLESLTSPCERRPWGIGRRKEDPHTFHGRPELVLQVNVRSTGTLPHGPHVVKIVRSNSSATGKYVTLDAVDVWGAVTTRP